MMVARAGKFWTAGCVLFLLAFLFAAPDLVNAGRPARQDKPSGAQPERPIPGKRVPDSEYAGSEMCGACHEEARAAAFPYHIQLETNKRFGWMGRGCEACHGAGKKHAESAEIALIFSYKTAAAKDVSQACLTCHAQGQGLRGNHRPFDAHSRNGVGCTSCHGVHRAKIPKRLLADKPEVFCATCHPNVRAEFTRPFRHALPEGTISCIDCHDQHGAPGRAQLRPVAGNEVVCLRCHSNLRGPFTFEHVPVRSDGCQSCHEPHGSVNPRLLRRAEVRFLCLECHTISPSTLGGSPPAFHDLRSPRFQNCTTCHLRIHGSYVDRVFER